MERAGPGVEGFVIGWRAKSRDVGTGCERSPFFLPDVGLQVCMSCVDLPCRKERYGGLLASERFEGVQ
jgi:hypothetical protein